MEAFDKVVRLGTVPIWEGSSRTMSIYCKIEYRERNSGMELTISGVEGPKADGNAHGACGQIEMSYKTEAERATIKPAPKWDQHKIAKFFEVWERWHLNRMRAGTPAQEAWVREHKYPGYPTSHLDWAREGLAAAGLEPDGDYSYGSKWLAEEVPEDVLAWLAGLPDTDHTPAWV